MEGQGFSSHSSLPSFLASLLVGRELYLNNTSKQCFGSGHIYQEGCVFVLQVFRREKSKRPSLPLKRRTVDKLPPSHLLKKNNLQSLDLPLPGGSQDRMGRRQATGFANKERGDQGRRQALLDAQFKPTVWEKEKILPTII